MKWYYIVGGIVVIKATLNLIKLIQCKHILDKYVHWLKDQTWKLVEKKSKVIALIKGAGISDQQIPVLEPVGYGKLLNAQLSVLDNFPSARKDIYEFTLGLFFNAIGVYRRRTIESFNPLFWIETIIYLPKRILKYLGLNPDSVSAKVLQLLWWFFTVAIAILIAIFQEELRDTLTPPIRRFFSRGG